MSDVSSQVMTPTGNGLAEMPKMIGIRRFGLADLEPLGVWLVKRLKTRYPVTDHNIASWLRGLMYSNEHLFVRSEGAVLLAQICHRPLSSIPIAEEVFLLLRDKSALPEGLDMYRHMMNWAVLAGAEEMLIERFSDVPHEAIKELGFGRILKQETYFVKVSK